MAKFCKRCGSALDVDTGMCPNKCNLEQKTENKLSESVFEEAQLEKIEINENESALQTDKNCKPTKTRIVVALFVAFIFVCLGVIGVLSYFDIVKIPYVSDFFDKISDSEIIEVDGTVTDENSTNTKTETVNDSVAWEKAYIDYLNDFESNLEEYESGLWKYQVFYLDNNDIPEIYMEGPFGTSGCKVIMYTKEGIKEQYVGFCSVIEKENLLLDRGGRMDSYYDKIYSISNNELTLVANGNYGASDNANVQYDSNGYPIYNYYWNDSEVSQDEYNQKLNSFYDFDKSVDLIDCVSYSEILSQLDVNTSGTPDSSNANGNSNSAQSATNDIIQKVNTAIDNIKSVHLSQQTTSNYAVSNSDVNISVALESDVDIKNNIMFTDMTSSYNGTNTSSQIYVKSNGATSDIYMHTNNMWVKQNGISIDELYKLGTTFEGVEGIKFYLNSLDSITIDSKSDSKNHIISGKISSADTEEALRKSGFAEIMEQLSSGLSDSEIQSLLNNLSSMKITFYIDKQTNLPTKMLVDMKDTTESLYQNLGSIATQQGESFTYNITTNEAITLFGEYDAVGAITIPSDALSGTDYTIIN